MNQAIPTIAPPKRKKAPKNRPDDGSGSISGWDSQVVLFNDDVNTFEHVIDCLMAIFGHGRQLAEKITLEAHMRGRAIAEVEPREKAEQHAAALVKQGLVATVESIG
jgi:ATP-dependent Clp protease adaptor protein ClpS